jgi:hypothetical protein
MGIHCSNNILAFGPEEYLVQIRQLIDDRTRPERDDNRTYFGEVFGAEIDSSVGIRWDSEEDNCIWLGERNPPMGFLRELSSRFPDLIFELRIDAEDVDYLDIYEFRKGIGVRRIHEPGPNAACLPPSNFEAEVEKRRRLLHCVAERLNDGVIYSAQEALRDLLNDNPHLAKELLLPIFECSEFWPETMAKEALGIDANEDFEIEELIEKFKAMRSTSQFNPSSE